MDNIINSVSWVEIPVSDFERAKKFYSAIFDYEMPEQDMGPNKMGFFPSGEKGVGAVIIKGPGYVPSESGALVYLNGGDNLDYVLERVEKNEGLVLLEKTRIGEEHGYYALFRDTEGNKVALHSMH